MISITTLIFIINSVCSSPSLIVWVGLYKNSLVEKFWNSLNEKLKKIIN